MGGRPFKKGLALGLLVGILAGCAPQVEERPLQPRAYGRPVRLACVGDSITACADCWPAHLAQWLGPEWQVGCFGQGGGTVLEAGDYPYAKLKLPEVLAFAPDAVVVVLGTNDSKPRHYYRRAFMRDYRRMLEQLAGLPHPPRVWIGLPPPCFPGQWGIDETRLRDMLPAIRKVARRQGVPVLDLHQPLQAHADWFPDQVHPDARASREMARIIYTALTGRASPVP